MVEVLPTSESTLGWDPDGPVGVVQCWLRSPTLLGRMAPDWDNVRERWVARKAEL